MWTGIKLPHMKLREDINMKNTFYAFSLLFLCAGLAAAADTAVNQAHRANADGALTNALGNDPESLRHGAGLNFDTSNPVKVTKQGNGPTKGYTYTKPDGSKYKVDLHNDIPQPSEAVDANDETTKPTNNSAASAKTNDKKQQTDDEVPYYQQLKEWAAKHKDPNDTDGEYAQKRTTPLRDQLKEDEETVKPQPKAKKVYKYIKPGEENLPMAEKDRLEKSRRQAAKRKAQSQKAQATQEEWVDPISKAKTQAEVREILRQQYMNDQLKQVLKEYNLSEDEFLDRLIAGYEEYQRPDYTAPAAKQPAQNNTADEPTTLPMTQGLRNILIVKGIKPENLRPVSNQPVNTQVKTVKKFRLAADIIKADKTLSEKEKQEFLEWDAKIRRQAEELKEQERQAEEQRKLKEQEENAKRLAAATVNEEDLKYGKFEQVCDPKIKNASDEACAMCCVHPKTRIDGFDPNIHVMTGGFLYMGTPDCHCEWQGKALTGYDTRNTSDQACTAYCLAHPNDVKGFNPAKHQMHYGELKKGQCKCHYIDKNVDICSRNAVVIADAACARCCVERPNNNRYAPGFDPAKHNMLRGYVDLPGDKKYRHCNCWFDDKPGMEADEHAAVTGASIDVPAPAYGDDAYTTAVCDPNIVHQTHGNCTKCCLAKQPQAPKAGYKLDFGYLNNGQCKCHFSNPNADVCDNERRLASDMGCLACCEAQPPANFNPDTDEMSYGRVVGNNCECHWKTRPQETTYDEPGCSFEEKNRSQSDCNRCCTDPSRGLVGGELESDGICVCLHR